MFFLPCLLFNQQIPTCHGGRSIKDGFAPPLSPAFYLQSRQRGILPPSSPARHFNPARTNREIKKLRHDERGSRRSAGCGQVMCRLQVFNQHRATCSFTSWNMMRLSVAGRWDRRGETCWVQHLLFILLIQPLLSFHLSCGPKGESTNKKRALHSIWVVLQFTDQTKLQSLLYSTLLFI